MFTQSSQSGYKDALPGVRFKTLAHGTRTLLAQFHLEKGSVIPRHSHPHEQAEYLVSGALSLSVGDAKFDPRPGDGWCVEGGVEHGAVALEDSVAVEVFSPVRREYLPGSSSA
jgi:quercetin dioxygenase-like cupin family protein